MRGAVESAIAANGASSGDESAIPRKSSAAPLHRFGDAICVTQTGRAREAWFGVLDEFDARRRGYVASATHLVLEYGLTPRWSQAITSEYGRARGLRPGTADGFAVTVQRALAVDVDRAWRAFAEAREVTSWRGARQTQQFREGGRFRSAGGERGEFRRIVPGRLVRFVWARGRRPAASVVEVEFLARGPERSTLKLTHHRMASAEERDELRAHWSWALDSLKSWVETGSPVERADWLATGKAR